MAASCCPPSQRVEHHAGVTVERVIGDGAYGSGENRAACAQQAGEPVDLVAPLRQPAGPRSRQVGFRPRSGGADRHLPARARRSPVGPARSATLQFTFPRATCEACPLFQRCVKSKVAGRTVGTHPYESYLRQARERQQTDEFKIIYRRRSAIERKQAELVQHGLRHTRYLGQAKRQLQRLWTAAVVNLKRLFRLVRDAPRRLELAPGSPRTAATERAGGIERSAGHQSSGHHPGLPSAVVRTQLSRPRFDRCKGRQVQS